MGGYSSGRRNGANCADDYLRLDVKQWQREGLLVKGSSFNSSWNRAGKEIGNIGVSTEDDQIIVTYNWSKPGIEAERLTYGIGLETTACHYGGVRYWFTCPGFGCGRRVAMLYLGDKIFACRHCYKLAYRSQRETPGDSGYRGVSKIRSKLGLMQGLAYPDGGKPKGMHWKTYWRLYSVHNQYAKRAMAAMESTVETMLRRLDKMKLK